VGKRHRFFSSPELQSSLSSDEYTNCLFLCFLGSHFSTLVFEEDLNANLRNFSWKHFKEELFFISIIKQVFHGSVTRLNFEK